MVDASKILTVSYGTFSCTLEGFDDPFSTMRGIAEYFRDLAAEDRYFGAEPPTPDAEMLHRIAEREVQQRVEARVDSDSITLRQVKGAPLAAAATLTEAANDTVETVETAPEPADVAPLQNAAPAESVAAKLARIRALSSENEFESGAFAADEASDNGAVDAESISSAFQTDVEDAEPSEPEEPVAVTPVEDAFVEKQPEAESAAEVDEQPDEIALAAQSDEAADPDQDVQAEVEETTDSENAIEDVMAEVAVEDEILMADDAELESHADEFEEDSIDENTFDENDGTIASIIGASLDQADVEEIDEANEPFDVEEDTDQPEAEAIARVVKMRRSDFEAAQEAEETPIQNMDFDSDEQGDLDDEPDDGPLQLVADSDADFAEDDEVEMDDEGTVDDAFEDEFEDEAHDASSLSQEDEADLMATLEQVKRQEAADMRAEKEGHSILQSQDIENSDDSVARILDVTNTEMEETGGTRRRSAIAHLKAAVAATRADKLLGRLKPASEDEDQEMDKYRNDLAKVVRPRRQSPVERPTTRRLAPLVLVNEQRVEDTDDDAAPENVAVVAPRRVSARDMADDENGNAPENMFRDGHSFAEFAQEMGAKELPDLLEAAAAFSSFVEGREHFSRPQIMKTVADLNEDEDFSREESLRSFGMLLRRGKIKKIKRGQFTIADTTRFNPEVRAVGE